MPEHYAADLITTEMRRHAEDPEERAVRTAVGVGLGDYEAALSELIDEGVVRSYVADGVTRLAFGDGDPSLPLTSDDGGPTDEAEDGSVRREAEPLPLNPAALIAKAVANGQIARVRVDATLSADGTVAEVHRVIGIEFE